MNPKTLITTGPKTGGLTIPSGGRCRPYQNVRKILYAIIIESSNVLIIDSITIRFENRCFDQALIAI